MSDKSEGKEFAGFSIPEKNYFPMPNNWTDICAEIDNLSELKVIQYVIRHTWGYQEYGGYKTISVDEFMHGRRRQDRTRMDNGTGLSEPSVKDGLKRAIKHGYLVCITNDKDKGRVKKSYGLKMHEASEQGKKLTGQETYPVTNLPPEVKDLTPRGQGSYPRTEKDTIERHLEKNKESEYAASEQSPDADTHPSFSNSSPSLPSDHNQVESLPTENKAVVNPPPFTKQERAERRKWAAYINEDENITREDVLKGLDLYHQWVAAYGIYGKAPWCDKALIWIAQQSNGTWENVQKVYDALPETAINPEKVANNWHRLNGKKKASSPKSVSGRRRIEETDPAYAEYLSMMTGGGK